MTKEKAGPERLGAFSDGVIAIIITIMVLDLKVPQDSSVASLLELWPKFAGYLVSYCFVGIVWVNHHHLLRYTKSAEPGVIWGNLIFLFCVSLVPFFTAYMAENHMSSFTTALYAANFLLVGLSYMPFERAVARQCRDEIELQGKIRGAKRRNWIALLIYALAIPAAYLRPALSLSLILASALLYVVPDLFTVNPGGRHTGS